MKIVKDIYDEHTLATKDHQVNSQEKLQIGHLVGENKRVLDIGCSIGAITEYVKSLGNEIIGVDISEEAVEICRQKGLEAFQHDIENDPPLSEIGTFDVVIMTDILEHLFDPYRVLVEKTRNLINEKGLLIVAVPNCAYLKDRLSLLFGNIPQFGANMKLPPIRPYNIHHKTFFNRSNLLQTLEMSGFKPLKVATVRGGVPRVFAKTNITQRLWRSLARCVPTVLAGAFIVSAEKVGLNENNESIP